MKTIFLETLRQLWTVPSLHRLTELHLDFVFRVPGIKGLGLRIRKFRGPEHEDSIFSAPFSPAEFLPKLDLEKAFREFPPGTETDAVFLDNASELLFAPLRHHTAIVGDLFLTVQRQDPVQRRGLMQFCEQAALILADKVRGLFLGIPGDDRFDSAGVLDTLLELHSEPDPDPEVVASADRERTIQKWADRDFSYLQRFIAVFRRKFTLDGVLIAHRVAFDSIQVVLSSHSESYAEIDPGSRELIEDLVPAQFGVPLSECIVRVLAVEAVHEPEPFPRGSPTFFAKEIGDSPAALFGVTALRHRTDPQALKMMNLLSSHLGFRFAHLCQQRKEELNRRMLQQINNVCNIITANVDVEGILDQLVLNLEGLFGQHCGAIFLVHPSRKELECIRTFGPVPEGFEPTVILSDPNHPVTFHIMGGSAFGILPEQSHPLIRLIVSFNPMPNQAMAEDITFHHQSVGGLVLFNSFANRQLANDLVEFLTILLNGVSASLLVAFNYQEKLDTIRSLEGLIKKLSNKDELLAEMIQIVRRLLKVNRCSFLTVDETGEYLVIEKEFGLPPEVVAQTRIPIGKEVSGWVAQSGKSLRIDNIEMDDRLKRRSQETYFNRSLLSVPLLSSTEESAARVLGVINVNNKISGLTFSDQDQKLLEAIAEVVVVALENSRLMKITHERDLAKARFDAELRAAREVQMGLQPKRFVGLPPSLDAFGRSIPALEVGGDFYEGQCLKDGRWLFAIGDVSGKGMPAALLMATTRTILRSVAQEVTDPAILLDRVNHLLSQDLDVISREQDEFHFVTLSLLILNPETGEGEVASAGHGPLLQAGPSGARELKTANGKPLGLNFSGEPYTKELLHLNRGDTLLFFTDGLFEERAPDGNMLGMDRVFRLFRERYSAPAMEVTEAMLDLAQDWRGGGEAHDDLTILAVKYQGRDP